MGAARAKTEPYRQPRCLQAVLYCQAEVRRLDSGGKGEELANGLKGKDAVGRQLLYIPVRMEGVRND